MKRLRRMQKHNDSIILAVLLGLLVLAGFLSLTCGTWPMAVQDVIKIILIKLGLYRSPLPEVEAAIVWDGRLPRFIVGVLVGFSLGAAGSIMQGLFKNPMASPGVIGIDSGAALGAVIALFSGLAG